MGLEVEVEGGAGGGRGGGPRGGWASGDRCLTTPSRPRLRPLSHPQFVQVAMVTDPST